MSKAKIAITVVLTMATSVIIAMAITNLWMGSHYYPKTFTVLDVRYKDNLVVVTDGNGIWEFVGCEDWMEGDTCSAIVYDNGTDEIWDDRIIKVRYTK